MTTSPIERAADTFAAELARWRTERNLSKKQLAARMGFDPSYVSHVEGRRHRPTEDFARRAEAVLGAGGAIWQRYQEYDELRHTRSASASHRDPPVPEQWLPPGTGLIVEQEVANLSYREGSYRCVIRRSLYNAGTEPVTRYLVRVAVDRYPNDPERSNRHHREHPLSFAELDLQAWCGDEPAREAMEFRKKHDRDAFKEVWLLFENADGRFPLYPGQRTTIEYAYTVSHEKWGQWFQRAVRLPTRRLAVRLDFPQGLDPQVWGVETSLSSEEAPLRTPLVQRSDNDRLVFEWATESPPLNARYRLEWRFRANGPPPRSGRGSGPRASERMRSVGIVQRGADSLRQPARQFVLPIDEEAARGIVERLMATLDRVEELHSFAKGVGLAAPQIGIPWAAAVVRPVDRGAEAVVLLNPRVVDASPEVDEQYEGCLSFFDVRGLVSRPLRLHVEHAHWDGSRVITAFEHGMARLVAHEIDHLEGRLYADRMTPGVPLVPIEEYREAGTPWRY
ncbi:peptide deformylase [Micromonospora sp. CPCC 206061]|uniref:peptide deformylase n=1 Tax=Micromonospora sp. CPCC 206061 TaxID=3122410 RepID=UPI002FEF7ECD